jgi:hypothetical protein
MKTEKEQIKQFKLLNAFFSSDRDFFKEVRNIHGHGNNDSSIIDGLNDNRQIADKFTKQYKELFNSNPSNPADLRPMMDRLCQ